MPKRKLNTKKSFVTSPSMKDASRKKFPVEPVLLPENHTFIANIKRLIGATSFRFDRYHELRKATEDEINIIREGICNHEPYVAHEHSYLYFWEGQWPLPRGDVVKPLSKTDWRYYVVTGLAGHSYLTDAFDLAPVELEVGFSSFYIDPRQTAPGVAIHATRFIDMIRDNLFNDSFFVDVSGKEIEAIQQICVNLQRSDDCLINVKRLAREIGQLKGIPKSSPLHFLGYFAILESVMTHNPELHPYDSISRQVRKKLILLDHIWSDKIDYSPFSGAKPETVWQTMYSYRSLIAHGLEPDFTKKPLSLLKNAETALKLIKETAKAVIRQALAEPQFLLDLKEC
jgi:hypothetical protein